MTAFTPGYLEPIVIYDEALGRAARGYVVEVARGFLLSPVGPNSTFIWDDEPHILDSTPTATIPADAQTTLHLAGLWASRIVFNQAALHRTFL